jgi:hypothetical protein
MTTDTSIIRTIQVGPHLLIQGPLEAKSEDGRMAKVNGTWGHLVDTPINSNQVKELNNG